MTREMSPSSAQLRLLLALVERGGEGYGSELTRSPVTAQVCRNAGWVTYDPIPGKPYDVGLHHITEDGRKAAFDAAPERYNKALEKAPPGGERPCLAH